MEIYIRPASLGQPSISSLHPPDSFAYTVAINNVFSTLLWRKGVKLELLQQNVSPLSHTQECKESTVVSEDKYLCIFIIPHYMVRRWSWRWWWGLWWWAVYWNQMPQTAPLGWWAVQTPWNTGRCSPEIHVVERWRALNCLFYGLICAALSSGTSYKGHINNESTSVTRPHPL